jgi:membrane-associated phospholipid phosphatase
MMAPRLGSLLALCALAFLALLSGVLWSPWIAAADATINASFAVYRTPLLLAVFLWVTALGANPTVVAVCVTATAMLRLAQLPGLWAPLWVAFLGGQATSWSVKLLVGRTRPQFLEVATATSPSFPSGHSVSAMAVYGFLAFVVARHGPPGRFSAAPPLALGTLILLIGWSRMFLSLHYASDVAGGWLVGAFWLLVAIALAERKFKRP